MNNMYTQKMFDSFKGLHLAKPRKAKLCFPIAAEVKFDGIRVVAIVTQDKSVGMYTRNKKFFKLEEISRVLSTLPAGLYDGELVYGPGSIHDRTVISGLINSARQGGTISETDIMFNVFDYLQPAELQKGRSVLSYKARKNRLLHELSSCQSPKVQYISHCILLNEEEVQEFYTAAINSDMEGLVLKDLNSKYEFKRSSSWQKMKCTKDVDLICEGVEEGKGKYEGMIGSLICAGSVEGEQVVVCVGSGMTDNDRSKSKDYYMYKTIEVKYSKVCKNKQHELHSLFLPRFVCVRTDK